jgi:exopolysaccharide biosynthesis polyprenyl glycosylphosphotransferase
MQEQQPTPETMRESDQETRHAQPGSRDVSLGRSGARFVRHVEAARSPLDADVEVPEADCARESRRRDAVYRRSLAAADVLAAAFALVLAIVVLGGDSVKPLLILALPLVVVVGKIVGLYDRDEYLLHKTTLDEAPALFVVSAVYTLILWLGEGGFVKEGLKLATENLGRGQVTGLWGLLFLSMLFGRAIARQVASRLVSQERCLVLGGAKAAEGLNRKLRSKRSLNSGVVGRVAFEERDRPDGGPPVLGGIEDLRELLNRHRVHRVVIAPTTAGTEQLLDAIRLGKSFGVKVSVLPRLFEVVGSSVRFDDVDGLMLLGIPRYGLTKSSQLVKRSMDLAGAGIGLVLLSPLFLAIALAIKLNSQGRVFFRQIRIGRDGREFEMLKFRTMVAGADAQKTKLRELNEADGLFKIADDPRLTGVGKLLRRGSLDELPQLINVLRGEMSLVGPRPLVKEDDEQVLGWQRRRLEIPPGMTGIWQVLGSSRIPLNEMVKIDYLYGANWSLWEDVKILLRTVPHVVGRRGL